MKKTYFIYLSSMLSLGSIFETMGAIQAIATMPPPVEQQSENKGDITNAYINALEKRIGKENIKKFLQENEQQKTFINWLESTPEAIRLLLGGGYASDVTQGDMDSYQYDNPLKGKNELKSLKIWNDIWHKFPNSHEGTNLKIAIAVSLEFANGINTWLKGEKIDPLTRYQTFSDAEKSKALMPDFSLYDVQEMRNIINAKISDNEIPIVRNFMEEKHNSMINDRKTISWGVYMGLIPYQRINPDTGESVHGNNFYGPNPTMKEVIKYGGVCGALSKFSSIVAQIYGVPALPIGQPGHCAYEYLDENHEYQLGNKVYDWEKSSNFSTTFPYMKINLELYKLNNEFKKSENKRYLAMSCIDQAQALNLLDEATEICPLNYKAWEAKSELVSSVEDFDKLNADVENALLKEYPTISERITNKILKQEIYSLFEDSEQIKVAKNTTQEKLELYRQQLDALSDNKAKLFRDPLRMIIDKAEAKLQQLSFQGMSNWTFASLMFHTDGSNYAELKVEGGKPHYRWKEPYLTISIKDKQGKEIYSKIINGDVSNTEHVDELTLNEGYIIEVMKQEPSRFKSNHNNELRIDSLSNIFKYFVKNHKLVIYRPAEHGK